MLRAASIDSSVSPRRRHCRLTRRRTKDRSRFFSAWWISHNSPGSTCRSLPNFGLAHAREPVDRKIAIVKLLHLPGQPTAHMHAVGDMADGDFLFDAPRPQVGPHAAGTWPCSELTALALRDSLSRQHRHAEGFALVLRLDTAQTHQLVVGDAQVLPQRAQVFFDQSAVEAVVTGGHRCVGCKDRVLGDGAQSFVKAQSVGLHPLANDF